MPTELILIRHGQSVPNVEPIIGGMRGDAGLTDRGRRQCALLEGRLRRHPLTADRLYSSTLPRALETAAYVSRALGLPIEPDDELQELRPGEADGMSVDEWRSRFPGYEHGPQANPYHPMSTGGESWATFLVRAGAGLSRLVRRHPDQTVVAVCHGGVLEASFFLALGLGPTAKHAAFAPANTSITHWRHRPPGSERPEWTLVTFNDTGHLVGGDDTTDDQAVPTPAAED